jgi:hypothetical protein
MKNWQFWMLFLALFWIAAGQDYMGREIFQQVRWITWKLDQDGSTWIKVDVER